MKLLKIEFDSTEVVKLLSTTMEPTQRLINVLRYVKFLVNFFQEVKVFYTFHEENRWLARYAQLIRSFFFFFFK